MAELSEAFIERLVGACSGSEQARNASRTRHRHADPIAVLSKNTYPGKVQRLRDELIGLAANNPDLLQHPALEWFLDNFYLVAQTAQNLKEDVPPGFYSNLATIAVPVDGDVLRIPRVYYLARELFEHTSSPPNRTVLEAVLIDFQVHIPLGIGELWAFPAMLRAASLEAIVNALTTLSAAAAADEHLALDSHKEEGQQTSLAVRTLIELKTVPWRLVFEHCSLVHKELLLDPAQVYGAMDFATCDRYRQEIESLAARVGSDELGIAERANSVAAESVDDPVRGHVGYWLVGQGRVEFERVLKIRSTVTATLGRTLRRFATPVYLSSIAVVTLLCLAGIAAYLMSQSAGPVVIGVACAVALVPASAFAIPWVQWVITNLVKPKRLPRLSAEEGIDDVNRTVVVIPTLLGGLAEVHELVQRLELHYLANPDRNLRFAILADYTDALAPSMPLDETLLVRAQGGIDLLNQRHGSDGVGPFHLLIRERRFNKSEGVWMGWERKRGKLEEFNRLLAGYEDTSYSVHVGNPHGLLNVRFVITLDSDTELPRDAARRLVATLAHPLNRAHFADDRLISGYTVLQPRLDISPDASNRSHFTRIFAGDTGLDIYSRAVSNVYQDFFGSGVYVGKGIYDVDAFRRCLEGRVPENSLLSHDLFEGIYGRAGLVTDVVLYEDYPSTYLAYARRMHRWIRGDWQLLPWLRRRVPGGAGRRIANPFSQIDRWKVLDNLRRSLLPVALLGLFVSGWTWLPGSPVVWTGIALVLSAGHVLTGAASRFRGIFGRPLGSVRRSLVDVPNDFYRWLLSLAFLPHEAVIVADAVARTTLRMALTRKRLLEWTTAAHTANLLASRGQRSLLWWEMLGGPVCAIVVAGAIFVINPVAIWAAAILTALWLVSPEIALLLTRPISIDGGELKPRQTNVLRQLSRRTWLFFETFVGPDDHWLPPDNVQMVPNLRIAHRTSPTNIGLYLASCATACDLGYIGLRDFCVRIQSTMRTLSQLPRHRGQLLNWYETQTLAPLLPKYVSTVDNGNFAAALISVRQACGDFATRPIFRPQAFDALGDVVDLLAGCVVDKQAALQRDPRIKSTVEQMRQQLAAHSGDPSEWTRTLDSLQTHVDILFELLSDAVKVEPPSTAPVDYEGLDWLAVLTRDIRALRGLVESFAGWFHTLAAAPNWVAANITLQRELPDLRKQWFTVGLEQLHGVAERVELLLVSLNIQNEDKQAQDWARKVREQLGEALVEADALLGEALDVGVACEAELATIDFSFLYDSEAHQMFIGYDATASQPDVHHYDLLASEARLASLIAIAFGQVPTKHWFHLGRPIARVSGESTLLSWSGTMFEYLMPLLFTRSFPKTLLGRSMGAAIGRQMQYARSRHVPWGISESAFASTDAKGDYQYRAFGTPGLGLKRGLEEDLVVAPYASVLAVGLRPVAVVDNIEALRSLGAWGEYGMIEAIDFTSKRSQNRGEAPRRGKPRGALVKAYMAHHQGMGMVAVGNLLAGHSMIERFHSDPRVQTVAHLLQERVPTESAKLEVTDVPGMLADGAVADRVVFPEPWKATVAGADGYALGRLVDPALHVLSNGNLNLLCDSFGRSRLWLTHGHEDIDVRPRDTGASADRAGSFCIYLQVEGEPRHLVTGAVAVAANKEKTEREVSFWPHKIESRAHFGSLAALEEVFIAPHENVEVRRLRLTNEGTKPVNVSVIGYAEIALQRPEEHHRHPAFSRLFLETSSLENGRVLLCRRRARGPGERFPVVAQALLLQDTKQAVTRNWETSRSEFVGRGQTLEDPQSWATSADVQYAGKGHEGHVLDPCLAQRVGLEIAAGDSQTIAWVTAVGIDEERALEALALYSRLSTLSVVHDQSARAMAQRQGHYQLSARDVACFQHLLSRLMHRSTPRPQEAGSGKTIGAKRGRLWGHGISGDRAILLLNRRSEDPKLVQQLLRAHRFFAEQNALWDLVILVHDVGGYIDEAREQIRRLAKTLDRAELHPNVSIVSAGQLRPGDLETLEAAAGLVLDTEAGELADQLGQPLHAPKIIPFVVPTRSAETDPPTLPLKRPRGLLFDNGFGGFDQSHNEYVMFLSPGESRDQGTVGQTPAPWCNVLSNPEFGALVSERGLGCTWMGNASENRLTPWSNDAVCDPASEVLYLRDEETAEVWTPTPGPKPASLPYEVAHGIGYTEFRHSSNGLSQRARVSVHPREAVKLVELILENKTDRARRVTATYFADWVLGTRSSTHGPHVVPTYAPEARALFARNPWGLDFPEQVAFLATTEQVHGFTVDPVEFLGLGGLENPDAMRRWGLSNSERSGALSCAALQVHLDFEPGERRHVHFALGWGETEEQALDLASRSTRPTYRADTGEALEKRWRELLGSVVVDTPDAATNFMLNSWALYQTISSRVFARTGFYQSSGAIGFRDQLQDVMSMSAVVPTLAHDHILEVAAHQFDAGDVLHWWHPPGGTGVRTRCSDDLLWLPLAVARYIETTGDGAILDKQAPFLTGPELGVEEHDHCAVYARSSESGSILEHCIRAIDRGFTVGERGLPLMQGGDWNDGMNLVGVEGRGESVWLGWFLYTVVQKFVAACEGRGIVAELGQIRENSEKLLEALEAAWDGAWYRRAYYDDGAALGSASSKEARIDSISQSWSVISGAARPERARQAVDSAVRELFDTDAQIVRLLWPPFDTDVHEPGYIKGYPPGIRENGAQYTHAATWLVWALLELGENEKAMELFGALNPINHATTTEGALSYAVEPYVLSGDVYSTAPHRGRGGWSWYTGSAAWYWRVGIEELLGCRVRWPYLEIVPRIPDAWPSCQLTLELGDGHYEIEIVNGHGKYDAVVEATLDNQPLLYTGLHPRIDITKYTTHHRVRIVLGLRSQLRAEGATS